MLQYEVAKKIYEELKEKALNESDDIKELFEDFLRSAVDYAKVRTEWSFLNTEERREQDEGRSFKHNGYMSLLTAVCRNLHVDGIDDVMPDRKMKGDFACYIALFLALEQR